MRWKISRFCAGEGKPKGGRVEMKEGIVELNGHYTILALCKIRKRTIFFLIQHTSEKGIFIRFKIRNFTYVKFKTHHVRKVRTHMTGHSLEILSYGSGSHCSRDPSHRYSERHSLFS